MHATICVYVHVHVCVHVRVHVCVHMCVFKTMCTCVCAHVCLQECVHMCVCSLEVGSIFKMANNYSMQIVLFDFNTQSFATSVLP